MSKILLIVIPVYYNRQSRRTPEGVMSDRRAFLAFFTKTTALNALQLFKTAGYNDFQFRVFYNPEKSINTFTASW